MRPETLTKVQSLIASGKMVEAIKHVREETGIGLKEAKDAVEALQRGEAVPALDALPSAARCRLTPHAIDEIKCLAARDLVGAIKSLRAITDLSLKEAKEVVEALRQGRPVPQLNIDMVPDLPGRCPGCGAAVAPSGIKWVSPLTAECLYCGSCLRAG